MAANSREAVIVGAARTPIGSFQGALASVAAPQLGATAIRAALERAKVRVTGDGAARVDEVYMGCVLPAGTGQAPARQAALAAGLPNTTPCVTVNKVCGSGLYAVMLADRAIRAGDAEVVVAGGMENMSQAPYYLPKARDGYRLGHGQVLDGLVKDGLWDVYNDFHMGNAAELCARECDVPRDAQDAFAAESYRRAQAAIGAGQFKPEIVAVEVAGRKGTVRVDTDEEPGRGDVAKLATLKPAFEKTGTVTAGNASSINDGAAALVVMSRARAEKYGHPILARIVGHGSAAQAPEWFTTAPAAAIEATLARLSLTTKDVDLYEINEAFAVVSIINNRKLGLDPDRVNIWGGAVALGHPIGASGARVLVTLLHQMSALGKKRGLASLCIGGGEAVALVVERP
ncbi:MAG TPA: thiolase family protein [Myxococcota bacterium]|jgi:acetyl-CoA C-acetyltransferase|nr:thiolase family protein [Myxococcota bacterium]